MNNGHLVPLPPDLEKEASLAQWGQAGWNALKPMLGKADKWGGTLADYGSRYVSKPILSAADQLLGKGKLQEWGRYAAQPFTGMMNAPKNISKWVNPSGIAKMNVKGDPNSWLNWGPLSALTGGEQNWKTLTSRAQQGGLLGQGGIVRGAVNQALTPSPELMQHAHKLRKAGGGSVLSGLLESGPGLNPSMGDASWYTPWNWNWGAKAGLAGRGLQYGAQVGAGVGLPAYGLYKALRPEEGDQRGLGQRTLGWAGETIGNYTPLGWATNMLPHLSNPLQQMGVVSPDTASMMSKATPSGIGREIGEQVGSGFNPQSAQPPPMSQEEYYQMAMQQQMMQQQMMQQQMMQQQQNYYQYPQYPQQQQQPYYQYPYA